MHLEMPFSKWQPFFFMPQGVEFYSLEAFFKRTFMGFCHDVIAMCRDCHKATTLSCNPGWMLLKLCALIFFQKYLFNILNDIHIWLDKHTTAIHPPSQPPTPTHPPTHVL